jgi:hypothetical protein
MGTYTDLWSSTDFSSIFAWCRRLDYSTDNVDRSYHYKNYGFSVRCLRDAISLPALNTGNITKSKQSTASPVEK